MPANWVVVVVVLHKLLLSIFVRFWIFVFFFFLLAFRAGKLRITFRFVAGFVLDKLRIRRAGCAKTCAYFQPRTKKDCVLNIFDLFLYFFLYYLCCCVLVCVWGICCSAVECKPATARTTATRVSDKKRPHRILDCTEPPQATTELCVCLPVGIADALSLSLPLSRTLTQMQLCGNVQWKSV